MEKVPGTCSESMPLLVQEPIGSSEYWVLSAEFWVWSSGFPAFSLQPLPRPASLARHSFSQSASKPEVPFMAGSFENLVRENPVT